MNKKKTMLGVICAAMTIFSLSECQKSNVQPTPPGVVVDSVKVSTVELTHVQTGYTGYNIQNSLPAGYVKDGSVDYTSYIQAAVNKYSDVVFPAFPLQINDRGITVSGSNKILSFLPGASLILKQSSKSNYSLLNITKCSNITINCPVIVGDRYNHIGVSEWGMGIGIYSSSNITIKSPKVTTCSGDGIYIGRAYQSLPSTNIQISDAVADSNGRNGISVVSVDGLQLISPYCKNANGLAPMSGIDIEPNTNDDEANNIVISNLRTENNLGDGLEIGLTKLHGAKPKVSNITVTNHVDVGSAIGLYMSSFMPPSGGNTVTGSVKISNSSLSKNATTCINARWFIEPGLKLTLVKPKLADASGRVLSQSQMQTLLANKWFRAETNGTVVW